MKARTPGGGPRSLRQVFIERTEMIRGRSKPASASRPQAVLERAQALVRSGECADWQAVMSVLRAEGLDAADEALSGELARLRLEFELGRLSREGKE